MLTPFRLALSAAIVFIIVLVFAVPAIIRAQIEATLTEMTSAAVEIGEFNLNVFTGTAHIGEMTVGPEAQLRGFDVQVAVLPLLDRRFEITSLAIDGLRVSPRVSEGELQFAGFSLPGGGESEPGSNAGWPLTVDEAGLSDASIALKINEVPIDIRIERFDVRDFEYPFAGGFRIDARLTVNDAMVALALTVDAADELVVRGQASTAGFELASIAALVPGVRTGRVSMGADDIEVRIGEGTSGALRLDLTLNEFATSEPDLSIGTASWQGRVELASIEPLAASLVGDVGASELRVADLLQVGALDLATLAVELEGAAPTRIAADRLALDDVRIHVVRSEGGEIVLPVTGAGAAPGTAESAAAEAAEATETTAQLPSLQVGSVVIGGDSRVRFTDRSTVPVVDLSFEDVTFSAEPVSTEAPMVYAFSARHPEQADNEAAIRSSGSIFLFGDAPSGEFSLDVSRFDLHEIDPYVGGGIQSGLLQLNADVNISDGTVRADNHIVVIGMKVDSSLAAEGQDMPISLALNLLRDKNDRVELDVPVEAGVDNLSVGVQDVVRQAVLKATRSAALTYAKFALQPFGSLLLLKDLADSASSPQFAPLEFEPGSEALSETATAYVQKLASLLSSRPGLAVSVCGYATAADVDAEGASLEADAARSLAEARGRAARQALRSGGARETQVLSCAPTVLADASEPRVVFRL